MNLGDPLFLFNLLDVFMRYGIVLALIKGKKARSLRRF